MAAAFVGLALLVLHFLLVDGPSLELLRAALLRGPKAFQTGHLIQLLQLRQQLQVIGHDGRQAAGAGRKLERADDDDGGGDEAETVNLAGAAAPCQTSTLHPEPGGRHRLRIMI